MGDRHPYMQDRNSFKLNNKVSFRVHCKLTPDVTFFCNSALEAESSAFVSGFQFKDCGNDDSNILLFMQHLG
jgi:hypothetical protein